KAIKDINGYVFTTAYDVVQASWDVSRKIHDRSRTRKWMATFLAALKRSVTANPGTPMSVLAKKRN
ncbi:Hypothetical protein FKW44_020129, partial [Caligus rogercresseyi]